MPSAPPLIDKRLAKFEQELAYFDHFLTSDNNFFKRAGGKKYHSLMNLVLDIEEEFTSMYTMFDEAGSDYRLLNRKYVPGNHAMKRDLVSRERELESAKPRLVRLNQLYSDATDLLEIYVERVA